MLLGFTLFLVIFILILLTKLAKGIVGAKPTAERLCSSPVSILPSMEIFKSVAGGLSVVVSVSSFTTEGVEAGRSCWPGDRADVDDSMVCVWVSSMGLKI